MSISPKNSNASLKLTPLGGCGEIGMNMTILEIDGLYYFIDCGSLFPDHSLSSVDLVIPQTAWLEREKIQPQAWLITHGHEDHIGALPFLYKKFPAPIYCPPFAEMLIKEKFIEAGISDASFVNWKPGVARPFRNLTLTPFVVNHSIADALGFFIETKHGNILHSGDYRIDVSPPEKSMTHENMANAIAGRPVKIMLSDSTNAFQVGTDLSEADLTQNFYDIFNSALGSVIVTTFSSNIWRMQTVIAAALKDGRKIAAVGRSLKRNMEYALKMGFLPTGDIYLDEQEIKKIPRRELCILCTGSQGEMYSGLNRMAYGTYDGFKLGADDTIVFSSRAIPGNEKPIGSLSNQLCRLGCHVISPKDKDVHVSGHGFQEDLKACIRAVKPRYFMPVHGELRHLLKHASLAIECGVPFENTIVTENGGAVSLAIPQPGITDQVQSGRVFVCQGGHIEPSGGELLRMRQNLGKNGYLGVSFVLPRRGYDLRAVPKVQFKGLPAVVQQVNKKIESIYFSVLEVSQAKKDFCDEVFEEDLRIAIRRATESIIFFKCVVGIVLNRLND